MKWIGLGVLIETQAIIVRKGISFVPSALTLFVGAVSNVANIINDAGSIAGHTPLVSERVITQVRPPKCVPIDWRPLRQRLIPTVHIPIQIHVSPNVICRRIDPRLDLRHIR